MANAIIEQDAYDSESSELFGSRSLGIEISIHKKMRDNLMKGRKDSG